MSDEVRAYAGLVQSIATELSRSRRARQVGAEYDDLYQEGLIAVWRALEEGADTVGADRVRDRMRDYMRWLGRHGGEDYEEMLPFNDEVDPTRSSAYSQRESLGRTHAGKDTHVE